MGRHPIEAAREAKFAKRRKGIVAYNQQARENYGVSLPALVRKPDEHRAAGSNAARGVPPDALCGDC